MKRVLYYALNEHDATSLYRMGGVLPHLESDEYEIINGSSIKDWSWAAFIGIDILIFQRPCLQEHLNLILLAKSLGVKVIADYDDNLLSVDIYNPTYFQYKDNKLFAINCIKSSDEIWVSTDSIKEHYSPYNKNIFVIPNSHNDYLFRLKDKKAFNTNTKRVIWRGGQSHQADIYENADKLVEVINKNTDWVFEFWGDRFIYLEQRCGDNYVSYPLMEAVNYFERLANYNPNIAMFPLCTTEFNKGKSNIAWIESTYSGAAFFGNTDLPEYINGTILPLNELFNGGALNDSEVLEFYNRVSWDYICDNLLLSKINEFRNDRILANI